MLIRFIYLSIYLSIYVSIYLSLYSSINLPIYLSILKPIGEDGEACGRGSSRAVGASSGAVGAVGNGASSGAVGAVGRAGSGHPHFEHANRAYDPGRLELLRLFGRRRLGCCH